MKRMTLDLNKDIVEIATTKTDDALNSNAETTKSVTL